MAGTFHVWAGGDAHVGTDIRHGRESLADALRQSESAFPWDIMLDVGDLAGGQHSPDDREGELVRQQYGVLRDHHRSQVYNVAGNHDANLPGEPAQWWFQRYGDPLGQNTEFSGVDPARRPFPVEGQWDHYRFTFGNVLVLMMSDRNDLPHPIGRPSTGGGNPGGSVTGAQFDWWVEQVESHPDRIIITVHHYMLKQTTVASGPWEGFTPRSGGPAVRDRYGAFIKRPCYHGYFGTGSPMGASYLYWCDGNPDAEAFERYLAEHPGAIDLWIGGHTHAHPDDTTGGRSHVERKWNVNFLNAAALTRYHGGIAPMSRPMTFTSGSTDLLIQCYLHSDDHAPGGFYSRAARTVPLRHRFAAPRGS